MLYDCNYSVKSIAKVRREDGAQDVFKFLVTRKMIILYMIYDPTIQHDDRYQTLTTCIPACLFENHLNDSAESLELFVLLIGSCEDSCSFSHL